jgi:chemotaxis regulatin CheY-phosphate phosphatase CheZ
MAVRHEVLYDTEAALRLVDAELTGGERRPEAPLVAAERAVPAPAAPSEFANMTHPAAVHLRALLDQPGGQPVGLAALPFILERANHEIQSVLANLRDSRDALQTATVEKIQHTNEKLKEVTSATEVAATDILDALDRAQGMIDDLDAADAADDKAKSAEVREHLRMEIFGMMGCLQFQDITTQQLSYAATVLQDMEDRLLHIAKLFDPAAVMVRAATDMPDPRTFDPNATTRNAEQRQALADTIFQVK